MIKLTRFLALLPLAFIILLLGCTTETGDDSVQGTRLFVTVLDLNSNSEVGGATVTLYLTSTDCQNNALPVQSRQTDGAGVARFGLLTPNTSYYIRAVKGNTPPNCSNCVSPPTITDQVVNATCKVQLN